MRWLATLVFALAAACEDAPSSTPDLIAHPERAPAPADPALQQNIPTGRLVGDSASAPVTEVPPNAPPPWPEMVLTPGRYSPEFATDYIAQVKAERAAFDAELAREKPPPKDAAEAKHRVISEKGRRARLMNKPQLADMTDEQISDILSFSPDMPSAPAEFARLLHDHPNDVHFCVDHARWFQFRQEKERAIAEYTRCGTLAEDNEEIRRYIHTQIAAVKAQH